MPASSAPQHLALYLTAGVVTFLISRAVLGLRRNWRSGLNRLLVAHILSFLACAVFVSVAFAAGGDDAPVSDMLIAFAVFQLFWFALDMLRRWRRKAAGRDTLS
jgi:hypothetical protein